MKLQTKFKDQFIANVLAATDTKVKHDHLCGKWQHAFETYIKAVVRKDFFKKYGNHEWSAAFASAASSQIFPEINSLYLSKELNPYFADSHYNCESVMFSTPITVPAYMFKHTNGVSLFSQLALPFTKQKSTVALVKEAKVLAELLWERKKELLYAVENSTNMKQFCKNYPELVKHFPLTGESNEALNLIANLRKMGFDNTEKKSKP
jgi:hypothetical protein